MHSMTAFAKQQINDKWGSAIWEIRSMNQRYLDIHIHLPEQFYELKNTLRNDIKKYITRGKIDCTLQFNTNYDDNYHTLDINKKLFNNIIKLAKKIKKKNNEGTLDPLKILLWPGMLITKNNNLNNIQAEIIKCFHITINNLIQIKEKEGTTIKELTIQRLCTIKNKLDNIKQEIPIILENKRKQLLKKIEDLHLNCDTNKLEQELFYFIQKTDISEEIDRSDFYIEEIHKILSKKQQPVGRKLEFLTQELHREINTLSSKANKTTIVMLTIEIKILIEQIREQIQNIE